MRLRLVVASGPRKGEEVVVDVPKFVIGRDRDCHLRCNSDVVSRHHCAVIVECDYVSVIDFSSKNGTYVDGVRVDRERPLQPGSLLAVGPLRFLVQWTASPSSILNSSHDDVREKQQHVVKQPSPASRGEEIVDDWLDRSDPGAAYKAGRDEESPLSGIDPNRMDSAHDAEHLRGEKGKGVGEEAETEGQVDTRSAATDALRKIGKMLSKKKQEGTS